MKKKDLRDGMIIETRNRDKHLLLNGIMSKSDFDGFLRLLDYNDDLTYMVDEDAYYDYLYKPNFKQHDVVRVYNTKYSGSLTDMFKDANLTLIWKREEVKLTDREVEILKALNTLDFNWIARDEDGVIFAYNSKPKKIVNHWISNDNHWCPAKKDIFNSIKWADDEPTKIDDLLKGV